MYGYIYWNEATFLTIAQVAPSRARYLSEAMRKLSQRDVIIDSAITHEVKGQ